MSVSKREQTLLDLLGKASNFYEDTIGILSSIFRLSESVGRGLRENDFYALLAHVLVEESSCDNASVFITCDNHIILKAASGHNNQQKFNREVSMSIGAGVAGKCALDGESILVNDVSQCEFFDLRSNSKVTIGSMLCVPIRESKRTIGVFNLSHSNKNYFTMHHVRMFELLGLIVGQLSILVGLYELFKQEYEGLMRLVQEKESSLQDITTRYKAVIDATEEMIVLVRDGRVNFLNMALLRQLPGTPDFLDNVFDEDTAGFLEEQFSRMETGTHSDFDLRCTIGQTHPIIGQFFVKQLGANEYLVMVKDISLKRHLEQRTMQNEKLTALGLLTSGIAHELNNKLTPILGFAELINTTAMDPRDRKRFTLMNSSANSAKTIVDSLLSFSRNLPPEKTTFDLRESVDRIIGLYTPTTKKKAIGINVELAPEQLLVFADMNCIEQVLVNLINNALDAIKDTEGLVTIRAFRHEDKIHIQVQDNGHGIPDEILPKIFDPFFTTKAIDKGTGLGLSICYGIITDHKGEISVENIPGGTLAQIKLPAASDLDYIGRRQEEPVFTGCWPTQEPRTNPYLIMVVEDEDELRHLMAEALGSCFDVKCFKNGREACNNIGIHSWDLIISDLRMPEMDGMELFREVGKHYPDLARRFLFVTGDTYDREVKRFLEETGVTFVRKPFRIKEFRDIVQNKIGAS